MADPILPDFSSGISKVTDLRAQALPQLEESTAAASEKPIPSRMLNLYPHHELAQTVYDSIEPPLINTLNTRENVLGSLIEDAMNKLGQIRPRNSKEAGVLKDVQEEISQMTANRELCNAYRRAALAG